MRHRIRSSHPVMSINSKNYMIYCIHKYKRKETKKKGKKNIKKYMPVLANNKMNVICKEKKGKKRCYMFGIELPKIL